ncbi:hypothetical protein C8F01DRAFT_1237025 [Mycena amicta]|nr:hypothetical protein C8F01DRAFT_1237025 [Mycena amicta]
MSSQPRGPHRARRRAIWAEMRASGLWTTSGAALHLRVAVAFLRHLRALRRAQAGPTTSYRIPPHPTASYSLLNSIESRRRGAEVENLKTSTQGDQKHSPVADATGHHHISTTLQNHTLFSYPRFPARRPSCCYHIEILTGKYPPLPALARAE